MFRGFSTLLCVELHAASRCRACLLCMGWEAAAPPRLSSALAFKIHPTLSTKPQHGIFSVTFPSLSTAQSLKEWRRKRLPAHHPDTNESPGNIFTRRQRSTCISTDRYHRSHILCRSRCRVSLFLPVLTTLAKLSDQLHSGSSRR